jgi:hypothetical protein
MLGILRLDQPDGNPQRDRIGASRFNSGTKD